jgi:hypothetical protein
MSWDILIRGGTIIDGSGSPATVTIVTQGGSTEIRGSTPRKGKDPRVITDFLQGPS